MELGVGEDFGITFAWACMCVREREQDGLFGCLHSIISGVSIRLYPSKGLLYVPREWTAVKGGRVHHLFYAEITLGWFSPCSLRRVG